MTNVLVVDDAPDYARLFLNIRYKVDHTPTLGRLNARIRAGDTWDVAFIDFEIDETSTGLSAFAMLASIPQPPVTVAFTVFKHSGGELYGAACKHWFGVRALLHKQSTYNWSDLDWRSFINRVLDGDDPTPEPRRIRVNTHGYLVDRLIRDRHDIRMWTALVDYGAHQKRMAESLGITTQNVKDWNVNMVNAVGEVEAKLLSVRGREFMRASEVAALAAEQWKGASQARLAKFADAHKMFFGAPDLPGVVGMAQARRRRS